MLVHPISSLRRDYRPVTVMGNHEQRVLEKYIAEFYEVRTNSIAPFSGSAHEIFALSLFFSPSPFHTEKLSTKYYSCTIWTTRATISIVTYTRQTSVLFQRPTAPF